MVLLLITSVAASSTPLLLHASRPACDWGLTDVSGVFLLILWLVQQKSAHSYESCHLGVCINSSGNLSNECRDVRWSCRCRLNLEERLVNILICVGWEHPEALSSFLCFHEILHYLWVWEGKFLCCTLYWNNFFFYLFIEWNRPSPLSSIWQWNIPFYQKYWGPNQGPVTWDVMDKKLPSLLAPAVASPVMYCLSKQKGR